MISNLILTGFFIHVIYFLRIFHNLIALYKYV